MKKLLPLAAGLLCATAAFSQITIAQADMPIAGDSILVSHAANTDTVDYTLTGPNYTWDFSTLVWTTQEEKHFDVPTALPFMFTASVAVLNPSPDSIPFIGAVPNNFTDYYKKGSSGYREIGISFQYAPLGNFSVPVIFNTNDYIYRFPCHYGNLDSSDASYGFQIPSLIYYGQTIHRVNTVDGWGTLTTPFGTFNTLRVRSVVNRVDTIGLDSVNGFTIPRPTEIEYKWLTNGKQIPVLEVDANLILNQEILTDVIYQDSLRDTTAAVGIPEINGLVSLAPVYPNPASGSCTINYTLVQSSAVEVSLTDLAGREVKTTALGNQQAGQHADNVNLAGVAPGVYMIRIKAGNGIAVQPLVVRN